MGRRTPSSNPPRSPRDRAETARADDARAAADPTSLDAKRSGPAALSSAARRGRLVATVLFYGVVGAIAVAAAVQVARQVFAAGGGPAPFATCRDGLRALAAAVVRARNSAPGTDGEDAAIDRFRRALEPDWSHRDAVAAACRASAEDERALDAIERLRYAEEHAVRREAGDLAPLRRRVQALVDRELATPTGQPPPSPP